MIPGGKDRGAELNQGSKPDRDLMERMPPSIRQLSCVRTPPPFKNGESRATIEKARESSLLINRLKVRTALPSRNCCRSLEAGVEERKKKPILALRGADVSWSI